MTDVVQGWQIGFITPSNTDQMGTLVFCIVFQRILKPSPDPQETKALQQLPLSVTMVGCKNSLPFPK